MDHILSTCCIWSSATTFKVTKNHLSGSLTYWDYGLGIFLISLVLAFTMGSTNGGPSSFVPNLQQADGLNLLLCGGWAASSLTFPTCRWTAGIEIVGLAIAFPISIGIAPVEGVLLSYLLKPQGSALLLFSGVAMALLAVILIGKGLHGALRTSEAVVSRKGVRICIVSGLLMGIFAPFVTRAMISGRALDAGGDDSRISTLGAFVCCSSSIRILMRKPLVGAPGVDLRILSRAQELSPAGSAGRGHLGNRHRLQLCRRQQSRSTHLRRHRSVVADDRHGMGHFCMARIFCSQRESEALSRRHVCCIPSGSGPDRQGLCRLKSADRLTPCHSSPEDRGRECPTNG